MDLMEFTGNMIEHDEEDLNFHVLALPDIESFSFLLNEDSNTTKEKGVEVAQQQHEEKAVELVDEQATTSFSLLLDSLAPGPELDGLFPPVSFLAAPPPVLPPLTPLPTVRTTHSRKRKHETSGSYVPRTQRGRSTFSYKFATAQEEVYYRLYSQNADKKSAKLNALVRLCHERFKDGWMTWNDVKAAALEVGYSASNNMFRCIWPLVVSRYGRNSETVQNCEVFGINFPYWDVDDSVQYKRGERGNTRLRLAPEFFATYWA